MSRVAIIGAGAAGMLTAFQLRDENVDVVVYEASDRVGGRLLTRQLGDDIVDLGAESFEDGEDGDWWKELVARDAVPKGVELEDPFATQGATPLWWYPGRSETVVATQLHRVDGTPEAKRAEQCMEANAESGLDIPVGRGVDLDSAEARVVYGTTGLGAFSESIEPQQYSAQDRVRNESLGLDMRPFLDGHAYGVGTLFVRYAGRLREAGATIQLDTAPTTIERGRGCWYVGVGGGRMEPFDAVVVTVSVAALTREKFPLPKPIRAALRDAFAGIELGGYVKVGLQWPEAAAALRGDAAQMLGYYLDPTSTQVWQVSTLPNSEVVVASTAGIYALELDRRRSSEATVQARHVVELVTRAKGEPTASAASTWVSDRRFGGCYSYSRPGAGGVRPGLVESVIDRFRPSGLFFAGEAFSLRYYGSVQATYETGSRAAAQCLTFLRRG